MNIFYPLKTKQTKQNKKKLSEVMMATTDQNLYTSWPLFLPTPASLSMSCPAVTYLIKNGPLLSKVSDGSDLTGA